MSYFRVDDEKCSRDGICVQSCPKHLLEQKRPSAIPMPISGAEAKCIKCGHCVAICPSGAFSFEGMSPGECEPVQAGKPLAVEEVKSLLKSRRSIRVYKNKAVEREKIEQLIDIARFSPTAINSQHAKWLVINSSAKVRELSGMVVDYMKSLILEKNPRAEAFNMEGMVKSWEEGLDPINRGAPALVIVGMPEEYPLAQVDSSIALTCFDLAAPSFGLGTCWAGLFMFAAANYPPVMQALRMPDGYVCSGAMMVGYQKHKYHRLPLRKVPEVKWL